MDVSPPLHTPCSGGVWIYPLSYLSHPSPHPPLQAHLEECGYKKVRCDLCHEGVLAWYIEQHMANECPEQTINCGYCNARVISKELLVSVQ